MWNEIAVELLDENTNKSTKFCFNKELNENTNKSTKFWLYVWQDWALAREYDIDIEKYVSKFVMLIINNFSHEVSGRIIWNRCFKKQQSLYRSSATCFRVTVTVKMAIKWAKCIKKRKNIGDW